MNMRYMFVTTEVSKLSGWLNADAPCREPKGGHAVRDDVRPGRREAAGNRGARSVQGRDQLQVGCGARGGAHVEHLVYVRDAGGVEAQRLVERLRILSRVERGAYGAGRGAGQQTGATASSVQGRARLQIWEQGTGRSAHRTCGPCS